MNDVRRFFAYQRFAARLSGPGGSVNQKRIKNCCRSMLMFSTVAGLLVIGRERARAQALPAGTASPVSTGFELPTTAGTLQFSLGASESLSSGYYAGSQWVSQAGANGNMAMITTSQRAPFSMILSGGYSWSTENVPSSGYVSLGASQSLTVRHWNFVLSDTTSYLPSTPSEGLSGVAGTGDVGLSTALLGGDAAQGLLTNLSDRVSNSVSLGISRPITGRLSAQGAGSYSILRFLGDAAVTDVYSAGYGQGLNTDSYVGSGGLSYVVDGRNTLMGNFAYSTFSYQDELPGFTSKTASIGITHLFSRRLTGTLSAGPQWTTVQQSNGLYPVALPDAPMVTTVSTFVDALATYKVRETLSYSAGYTRGTNAGFGVTPGIRLDSVRVTASQVLREYWRAAANVAYSHSTSVGSSYVQNFSPTTLVAAGQISRSVGRSMSVYGSYTREKQSGTGTGTVFDIFTGSFQVVGFGFTYAPPGIRFGHH